MAKKKIIKIIVIVVILIVVLAGGLFGLRKVLNKSVDVMNIYTANLETYENCIEVSGTVAAANEQVLQAKSAGTVLKVFVKAGDVVKKGDILIQLDDTTEQYNLAKHDYDMQITRITGSARELSLKQTQRLSLVQKIADRKVVATFDGVIADFTAAVGDSLEAKDKVGTLVNKDYLTAEVEVSETDYAKLEVGQLVNLSFSACSEKVQGYVESFPAIGEVTSRGATVVKAKIRIDEYPEVILPNFSFTGKIQIEEPVDYIVLDRLAIGYDENKQPFVVLAKTGEKISVKVVPYGMDHVKVLEGLNGGEKLLQQTKATKSGERRNMNRNGTGNSKGNTNGMSPMGGMPPR